MAGSDCVKPGGISWVDSLGGPDYKTCKGNVQPMLSITGYANNGSRVPATNQCFSDNDCAIVGASIATGGANMVCIGPQIPRRGKYCYFSGASQSSILEVDNRNEIGIGTTGARDAGDYTVTPNVTPCVRTGNGVTSPMLCNGTSDVEYTCVYCPATGERNWTFLAPGSEAAKTQIGVCQTKDGVIGTPCGS